MEGDRWLAMGHEYWHNNWWYSMPLIQRNKEEKNYNQGNGTHFLKELKGTETQRG